MAEAKIKLALEGSPAVVSGLKQVEKQVNSVTGAVRALVPTLTVGAFAAWVKSAINAAEEMGRFGQKTGMATESIAGLQLAARQAGLENRALERGLIGLQGSMTSGSKALDAMGISARNADGSMRSVREVLGDVANRFASYNDGAEKMALATELMGRRGAEMIPLLNGGSDALDAMDETARRLGLTLDEETTKRAAEFNDTLDLVGQGVQGAARQIAANLLPTLNAMASEMLSTSGDVTTMAKASEVLNTALKLLYSTGAVVVGVFRAVGQTVGAVAASVMQVAQGEFRGAWETLKSVTQDVGAIVTETVGSVSRVWHEIGDSSVSALGKMLGAAKKDPPAMAKTVGQAMKSIKQDTREAERAWRDYMKAMEDAAKLRGTQMRGAREMLQQIQFETQLLGMNARERSVAVAMRELEQKGVIEGTEAYKAYAEAIRDAVINKEMVQANITAQEAIRAEWERTTEQMEQSLMDALMQGGRSVAEYLRGLFRQLVLRPILAPVATAAAGMIYGAPAAAAAGAAGGANGLLSGASNLASLGGLFGSGGAMGALMGGMGWLSGATTLSGALGAAGSLIGTGTVAGAASGMMMGLGAIMPILAPVALLAGAWSSLFGRKLKDQGLEGTFGGDAGFAGNTWQFFKGGLFRSNKTKRAPLDAAMAQTLAESWAAVMDQVMSAGGILGLDTGTLGSVTSKFKFSAKGKTEEQISELLQKALRTGSNKLAQALIGANSPFARAGEEAIDTLGRLANSLQVANNWFSTLGQTLLSSSMAGGGIASRIMDAVGGPETFSQLAAQYLQDFYSDQERVDIARRAISEQLGAMGLAMPGTTGGYRALIEQQQTLAAGGSDEALTAYTTLLQLAAAFAEMTRQAEGLADASRQVTNQWAGVADGLRAQAASIRGDMGGPAGGLAALQAQFAVATAQAMAGDLTAAQSLTGLSQSLLSVAPGSVNSAFELQQLQAQVAESLDRTADVIDLSSATTDDVVNSINQQTEEARVQSAALADMLDRIHRIFRRWEVEGMPPERTEP